ncbi:MAG: TRAP transporter small permease subunit [Deltaproteobacteria bacterium]|nr:TRAP transporter small permease subunit [Deltaproteobacteria bacterium]
MSEISAESSKKLAPKSNSFFTIIDNISLWSGKIFSVLIVIATFQVCFELVLRYFFNSPTVWGLEMTTYLCAATYIMSGAYAEYFDAHIRVDVLYRRWSKKTKAVVGCFVDHVVFFLFGIVLVIQSGRWTWDAILKGTTSGTIWDPHIWPMRLLIFLGSLCLVLQRSAKFVRDFNIAFRSRRLQ